MENSPPGRRPSAIASPCQRSRVTNGKTLFVEADNRGPWARRFRDVLAEITSDLGGADVLSEARPSSGDYQHRLRADGRRGRHWRAGRP